MIILPTLLVWPDTTSTLRQILDIHEQTEIPCRGRTKKNVQCTRVASKASCHLVQDLLARVALKSGLDAARKDLQRLSGLVFCQKSHQYQSAGLLAQWESALTGDVDDSETNTNSVKDETRVVPNSTGRPVKKETKIKGEENDKIFARLDAGTIVKSETRPSVRETPITRSQTLRAEPCQSQTIQPEAFPRRCLTLQPLKRSKSTREKNLESREYILRPLLKHEKLAPGSVYIYKQPATETDDASPYLKIGSTKDIERRMKQWQAQCHYKPFLVADIRTNLYVKVERLVHKQLHNQRRREIKCAGCSRSHCEWFDTTQSEAEETIDLWVRWSQEEPYDEAGMLKPKWVERLRGVDLDSEDCWKAFVDGVSDVSDVSDVGDESGESDESDGEEP